MFSTIHESDWLIKNKPKKKGQEKDQLNKPNLNNQELIITKCKDNYYSFCYIAR